MIMQLGRCTIFYLVIMNMPSCVSPKFASSSTDELTSSHLNKRKNVSELSNPISLGSRQPDRNDETIQIAAQESPSKFFAKIVQTSYRLSLSDRERIEGLSSREIESTSLSAAISIIGNFKICLNQVQSEEPNTIFLEEDLQTETISTPNQVQDENKCLEQRIPELPVDIFTALETNPYLKSHASFLIFNDIATLAGPSGILRHRILETIHREERKWLDLISSKQNYKVDPKPKLNDMKPEKTIEPPLEFSATKGESDFAVLDQAQELMDQNRFKDAIRLLESVKEDDMIFSEAMAKIKESSNMAISNLRKQAAKSFENAISIQDPEAKQNYLIEAKKMLELALSQFPQSDQIATVENNLKIIQQNIASLSEQIKHAK